MNSMCMKVQLCSENHAADEGSSQGSRLGHEKPLILSCGWWGSTWKPFHVRFTFILIYCVCERIPSACESLSRPREECIVRFLEAGDIGSVSRSLGVVNELESSRQVVITKLSSHLWLLERLLIREVVGSFDLVVASYIKEALTRGGDASGETASTLYNLD